MLNVQRLKVLREVASRGTIAAAAEALWVTPSAVSQQLSTLEREVGVELLERDGRRVRLTEAGERLISHAERILADIERAEADLASASTGVTGLLYLSAFPTAARSILVPTLARLRREHPNLRTSMVDLEPEESVPALKTGRLDLVLTYEWDLLPTLEDPGIERSLLLTEPVYLLMHADHPLVDESVGLRDLASEQWIVGRDATSMLGFVLAATHRAGFEPRTDLHAMDVEVILAAVEQGLGVSLLPSLALIDPHPNVVAKSLEGVSLHRRIYTVVRRGSAENPAIAASLAMLRDRASEVESQLIGTSKSRVRKK